MCWFFISLYCFDAIAARDRSHRVFAHEHAFAHYNEYGETIMDDWDETDYYLLEMMDSSIKGKLSKGLKATKEFKAAMIELKDEFKTEQSRGKQAFLDDKDINFQKLKDDEQLEINAEAMKNILLYFITDSNFWKKTLSFIVHGAQTITVATANPAAAKAALEPCVEPALDFAFAAMTKFAAAFAELFKSPASKSKLILKTISEILCKLDPKSIAQKVNAKIFGTKPASATGAADKSTADTKIELQLHVETMEKEIATEDLKIEGVKTEMKTLELQLEELKSEKEKRIVTAMNSRRRMPAFKVEKMLQLMKNGAKKAKKALKVLIDILVHLQWQMITKLVKTIQEINVEEGINGIVNVFADAWIQLLPEMLKQVANEMGHDLSETTAKMLTDSADHIFAWKAKILKVKEMIQEWFSKSMSGECAISSAKTNGYNDDDSYDGYYEVANLNSLQSKSIYDRSELAFFIESIVILISMCCLCACGATTLCVVGWGFLGYIQGKNAVHAEYMI